MTSKVGTRRGQGYRGHGNEDTGSHGPNIQKITESYNHSCLPGKAVQNKVAKELCALPVESVARGIRLCINASIIINLPLVMGFLGCVSISKDIFAKDIFAKDVFWTSAIWMGRE